MFSLLDKLGTLMNDKLELRTERIKTHFSYFTVLRNMRQNRLYPELTPVLNGIKERHQEAMGRLRKRRNVEVHQMNAELQDDLRQSLANGGDSTRLENLSANMADLDEGWEMARETLLRVFRYFGAGMPR